VTELKAFSMAKLLPVLAALSPLGTDGQHRISTFGNFGSVLHTPYWPYWIVAPNSGGSQSIIDNAAEEKDRNDLRVLPKVPEENYKECVNSKDSKSFYDFTTEDVEKLNNVSFNDPKYKGKVLLVVNLASF